MSHDRDLVGHMIEALADILEFTQGGRDEFDANRMIQMAVLRCFEILGEAAKGVSANTRQLADDIPWKRISGMRDKLIHAYFGVNLDLVWGTVETELPDLRRKLERLLSEVALD